MTTWRDCYNWRLCDRENSPTLREIPHSAKCARTKSGAKTQHPRQWTCNVGYGDCFHSGTAVSELKDSMSSPFNTTGGQHDYDQLGGRADTTRAGWTALENRYGRSTWHPIRGGHSSRNVRRSNATSRSRVRPRATICLESGCALEGEACLDALLKAGPEYHKACARLWTADLRRSTESCRVKLADPHRRRSTRRSTCGSPRERSASGASSRSDGLFGPVRAAAPAGHLNDQNAEQDQRARALTGKRNRRGLPPYGVPLKEVARRHCVLY